MSQIHCINDNSLTDVEYIFDLAIEQKNTDKLINFINSNNIDINQISNGDIYKNSLLQIGVKTNNIKLVKFLLDKGSNIKYKNKLNENIYDIAIQNQYSEIIQVLQDYEQKKLKQIIKELESSVKYFQNLYKNELNKVGTLKIVNEEIKTLNDNLTKKNMEMKRISTNNVILETNLRNEKKRKREMYEENQELKISNKKLKTTIQNMSNLFEK